MTTFNKTKSPLKTSTFLSALLMGGACLFAGKAIAMESLETTVDGIFAISTHKEQLDSPLIIAIKKRDMNEAKHLVQYDIDVNKVGKNGQTALHWACILRQNNLLPLLLERGALNYVPDRFNHLPHEYYTYNMRLMDVANPIVDGIPRLFRTNMPEFDDLYNHMDQVPLMELVCMKCLIEARCKTSVDNSLMELLQPESTGILSNVSLEAEHQHYVDDQIEKAKKYCSTINYRYDLYSGHKELDFWDDAFGEIRIEKERARFVNAPLSLAIKNLDMKEAERLLTTCSPEMINAQSVDGFTALHWAAMLRKNDLIKQLLSLGADVSIQSGKGKTAKDYYEHKIDLYDFKPAINQEEFMRLHESYVNLKVGTCGINKTIPEFIEVFSKPHLRDMLVPNRNNKFFDPEVLSLLG